MGGVDCSCLITQLVFPLLPLVAVCNLLSRPREAINFCIIPRWFGFMLKRRCGEIWNSCGVERARVNAFECAKTNCRFSLVRASWLLVMFLWLLAASIFPFKLDTDGECTGLGESESPESSEFVDERQSSFESFSRWPCLSSCSRLATSLISSCIRFSGSSVWNSAPTCLIFLFMDLLMMLRYPISIGRTDRAYVTTLRTFSQISCRFVTVKYSDYLCFLSRIFFLLSNILVKW